MPESAKEPQKAPSKQRRILQDLVNRRVSETLEGGDGSELLDAMRPILPPPTAQQPSLSSVKTASTEAAEASPKPAAAQSETPRTTEEFRQIPLDLISPNPHQPRTYINEEADTDLANSIKQRGVIQPIVVRPKADGRFELISGERRFRASREAGKTTVPAIIRNAEDTHSALDALVENVHREDLGPLEVARAYDRLLKLFHIEQEALAELLGMHVSRIRHSVRVLALPPDVLEEVLSPKSGLKLSHAEELLALRDNPPRLRQITKKLLTEQWSIERLRAEIQRRPRVNRGYQPVVFEDRGDKGYRLSVRLQSIRPQDYAGIREKLELAMKRLTEFESAAQAGR